MPSGHYWTKLLNKKLSPSAECHHQLLERQLYSVARLCPDQSFLSLCHQHRVAAIMLYQVNSNFNHSLFSELPSACTRVRQTELRPQLIHWSFKYQSVECPNLLGLSCRLGFKCGMTFPTLSLTPERWMGSGCSQPLVASMSCVFIFRGAGACGVAKAIYK